MRRPFLALLLLPILLGACSGTGWRSVTPQDRSEIRPQPDGARTTHWNEMHVAWENRGGGSDALVFVHGWGGDRSVWKKQLDGLAPWRRIAIDLPGHGASDKPRIDYNQDTLVGALLAVLDDAGIERAVLVGHSNGGVTVRHFLALHPERVAGLVLVDAPLEPLFASPAQGRAFVAPLSSSGWKEWVAKFADGMLAPMHDAAERKHVRALLLGTPQYVLRSSFEGTLDPTLWRKDPIGVPLMLLLAKQPAWEGDVRARAEKIAPGLRWEMLEGVSHFLMLDDPERTNALLRSFLLTQAPFAKR